MLPPASIPSDSALNPTSTHSKSKSKPALVPRNPLTTQGKIAKAKAQAAKAKRNVPREPPFTSTNATFTGEVVPPARAPKRGRAGVKEVSLPPPGELSAIANAIKMRKMAAAKGATVKGGTWNFGKSSRKPLTTQEKIAAVKAASASKAFFGGISGALDTASALDIMSGSGVGRSDAKDGVRNKDESKVKTAETRRKGGWGKVSGMFTQFRQQSEGKGYPMVDGWPAKEGFTTRFVSDKVKRIREEESAKRLEEERKPEVELKSTSEILRKRREARARTEGGEKETQSKETKEDVFEFLRLPEEVRKRVIRCIVVDTTRLIWPEKGVARQQPDLSMVCRGLREEVLKIYYTENTFGISINLLTGPGKSWRNEAGLAGLAAVHKWATCLADAQNEDGKWFSMIQNWSFEYECANSAPLFHKATTFDDDEAEDESFVVSVQFPTREKDRVSFSGPTIEVHRSAACIMPGSEECGQCVVRHTPRRLNGMVIAAIEEGRKVTAGGLEELIKVLRNMVEGVAEARCEVGMVPMRNKG